jgi:hypothetical protein
MVAIKHGSTGLGIEIWYSMAKQNLVRIGGFLEAWKIPVVYRDREIL